MKKSISCAIVIAALTGLNNVQTAGAEPLPIGTAAMKAAAPSDVVDVRYRGGGAIAAGIAFGLLGAAIAGQYYAYPPLYYYYPPYPYYPPYGYYGPYWGGPYVVYHAYPPYPHYHVRSYRLRHRAHR